MHTFVESRLTPNTCSICRVSKDEHHCSVCECTLVEKLFGNMLFCAAHKEAELAAQKELEAGAEQRVRELENNRPAANIPQVDSSIQVSTDIFNAKIASIEELRKQVESDETITNKHFALAQKLEERYNHLKSVITEAQNTLRESQNEHRAIQTYYNELAKKLRDEERERIKIQDVQYRPPEKPTKKPTAPKVKVFDKHSIKQASADSGIPEMLITLTCTARNISAIEAVRVLRESGFENKGSN
jgi:hypothetical protein